MIVFSKTKSTQMGDEYSRNNRITFTKGYKISKYQIVSLVGQGGYGDVYKARDTETGKTYALKTEYLEAPKQGIKREVQIMSQLDDPCFPKVYGQGTTDRVSYLVMDLYGISVGAYRRQFMTGPMSCAVLIPISREMLRSIAKFHKLGYVHRDIKPSNFLFQRSNENPLCLIDFGLAKPHIDRTTGLPMPCGKSHFTGTKKYASLNAHEGLELGRRDDLFSWFYSVIELGKKRLPWSTIKSPEETAQMKLNIPLDTLCHGLPPQFISIYKYLVSLKYEEEPAYQDIDNTLAEALVEYGASPTFNWVSFYDSIEKTRWDASEDDTREEPQPSPHNSKDDNDHGTSEEESEDEGGCCLLI